MSSIKEYISNNKMLVLGIIFSPLIMYVFGNLVNATFNMGTYLGSYIREIISLVC